MRLTCKRCIMDSTANGFTINKNGTCSYCEDVFQTPEKAGCYNTEIDREKLIKSIKEDGVGKKYDCIIGVSGGADSSWALHLAKIEGLRPLAVHMDNGWNSELAQNNITNLIDKLDVDFYSHVINWFEYRSLMQSFFNADVIDIELLYDNAMLAVNYRMARKYKIKYILSGSNRATEGMKMPTNWNWYKLDKKNILSIDSKYEKTKIKTFPLYSSKQYLIDRYIRKIRWVPFLDYFHYEKQKAMNELTLNYDFKQYPYKHYESVFTRFYQGYLLPEKFGVDKRKLHLSTLIASGQITRQDALENIKLPAYPKQSDLKQDIEYFLKKMKWTQSDLNEYVARGERTHMEFETEKDYLYKVQRIFNLLLPTPIRNIIKGEIRDTS